MMELDFRMEFRAQMWVVNCPQIPGLLATGGSPQEALQDAAKAISDLATATMLTHADTSVEKHPLRNIFKFGVQRG